MTAEEAIAIITGAQVMVTNRDPDKFVAAIDRALIALRLEMQRDNPKPLTIEELKQMKGEPVWVQGPGQPEYGRWAIVEDAFGNSLYLLNDYTCHDIGKTWEAYRHKPKEEAK